MSIPSGVILGLVSIILTCLGTSSGILWLAAEKSQDIVTAKADIAVLKTDVREVMKAMPRLEEQAENIDEKLDDVAARLHGISTQVGLVRSEGNARSH